MGVVRVVVGFCLLALGCGSSGDSAPAGASGGRTTDIDGGETPLGSGGTTGNAGRSNGGEGGSNAGAGNGSGGSQSGLCGGHTSNHVSGTRVRRKVYVTSEGDRAWAGFHDTELGEDCRFQLIEGTTGRCLPATRAVVQARYFTDAACSDVVYALRADCVNDYLVVRNTDDACTTTPDWHVYERGELFTPSGAIYGLESGACAAVTVDQSYALYRAGPEHDLTEYVPATLGTIPGTGRLTTRGWMGDGGLVQADEYYDAEDERACRFVTLTDGAEHCASYASASRRDYDDPSCTNPLYLASTVCGREPEPYVVYRALGSCEPGSLVRKLEAEFNGQIHHQGETCEPVDPPMLATNQILYRTTPAEPDVFPAVEDTIDLDDPGRLKPIYRSAGDDGCLFYGWYDSELETECDFLLASDGEAHCLPPGDASALATFLDAECSVEAFYVVESECPSQPVPQFVTESVAEGCDRVTTVRAVEPTRIAAADLPSLYQRSSSGACTEYTPSDEAYFAVSAPLDPGRFVRGTLQIE